MLAAQDKDAEFLLFLDCPALGQPQKVALAKMFTYSSILPPSRLRMLGDSYVWLFGVAGSAEPYCGIEGLFEN
jgi:hypothetical protein